MSKKLKEKTVLQMNAETMELDDFKVWFCEEYGSAAEIWMDNDQWEYLVGLAKGGREFKSEIIEMKSGYERPGGQLFVVMGSTPDFTDETDPEVETYIRGFCEEQFEDGGWVLFNWCDNIDQHEVILCRE